MATLILTTDFGWDGPYVGQMKCAALDYGATLTLVDLMHDLPCFNPRGASYLLASYVNSLPQNAVVVAVVDPGVGTAQRAPLVVEADGRLFVGPGHGLFDQIVSQARNTRSWRITWQPKQLSATFHGRDLFMPVAAMLASGTPIDELATPDEYSPQAWPADVAEVIYLDHYGNGVTGLRAQEFTAVENLQVNGVALQRATTFAEVERGQPFFYANSSGLLEIAVNQGSAAELLALTIGTPLRLL